MDVEKDLKVRPVVSRGKSGKIVLILLILLTPPLPRLPANARNARKRLLESRKDQQSCCRIMSGFPCLTN